MCGAPARLLKALGIKSSKHKERDGVPVGRKHEAAGPAPAADTASASPHVAPVVGGPIEPAGTTPLAQLKHFVQTLLRLHGVCSHAFVQAQVAARMAATGTETVPVSGPGPWDGAPGLRGSELAAVMPLALTRRGLVASSPAGWGGRRDQRYRTICWHSRRRSGPMLSRWPSRRSAGHWAAGSWPNTWTARWRTGYGARARARLQDGRAAQTCDV